MTGKYGIYFLFSLPTKGDIPPFEAELGGGVFGPLSPPGGSPACNYVNYVSYTN